MVQCKDCFGRVPSPMTLKSECPFPISVSWITSMFVHQNALLDITINIEQVIE